MGRKNPERRQQAGAVHEPVRVNQEDKGYKDTPLRALTLGQKYFLRTLSNSDVTICTGPPGTGKTHIACGMAAQAMRHGDVEKIVLCRPVGGMEKEIGYLPGGIRDKLGPYLVPLFDELSCYMTYEFIKHLMDVGRLEIVPLAALQGRTFKDSFVVLDEAQNASYSDLKMFFTRFGEGSTVVASGDIRQKVDHVANEGSLSSVIDRLYDLEGVGICHLTHDDVVRHELTAEIDQRL